MSTNFSEMNWAWTLGGKMFIIGQNTGTEDKRMMNIGIDVGGTNLVAGLVNAEGKVLIKKKTPTLAKEGYAAVTGRIVELIAQVRADADGMGCEQPGSIGVGVPGIVSGDGKTILSCPNLFWENMPLKADLEAKTGLPVFCSNDATVAGIAEHRFGSSQGYADAVMFTLGTGVGGSVIADGKVVNGVHGVASEFGHMIVGEGLYTCNCGKKGCLETYASATGIIWLARKRIEEGQPSSILEAAGQNLEKIDAEMVINGAKAGDAVGRECFDSMVSHLAIAISNITDILDPAVYVLGGGVAHAGEFNQSRLRDQFGDLFTKDLIVTDFRFHLGWREVLADGRGV
ncbi:MAG: ROK family protein, partial [Eubacterium sp.]